MPLLGKEPFVRQTLPPNISPEDEVFFCKTTNEAFITYDQFFERQILCSSMVWTCSITGRTGLTYEEALESERNANDMLTAFPTALQIPVLYLMNYINESKFGSIVDMICTFISNRYFIGEDIENIITSKKRFSGKVVAVIPPTDSEIREYEKRNKNTSSSSTHLFGIDPSLYKYEIIDNEKHKHIVGSERIVRTKGVLTKDKVRLFLKQHLTAPKRYQPMAVKDSSIKEFNLKIIKWHRIFSGPEPHFEEQTVVVKTYNKDKQKTIKDLKHDRSDISHNSHSSSKKSINKNKKSSSNSSLKSSNEKSKQKNSESIVTFEDKQRQREEEKQLKLEQKKIEKEQKKLFEENMKEWNAKRDDLACDDLRPLPEPVPLKCKIPVELFADSVLVMEFLHCFSDLFDLKSIFPFGITFELMEKILFDADIHSPFADLIKIMLTSNLTLQEEEDENTVNHEKDENSEDEVHNEEEKSDKFIETPGDKNANYYHNWIQSHLGLQLSKLSLDSFNITEVLRLHFLSSGAGPKPRLIHRGLYQSREDPSISFVLKNNAIISKLESKTVFDLNPNERLKVLHVLIHQMLTFEKFRDHVDNAFYEMSRMRKKIRDIQTVFSKWKKENSLKRFQNKKESFSDKTNNENHSQTSVPTAEQLEEYRKEKSHREEEMLKSCGEIRTQLRRLQACYALKPIGSDRAFRRYWIFESLPGLFVEYLKPNTEYTNMPFGPCLEEPTPAKSCKPNYLDESDSQRSLRDDTSTTSDKENEMNTSLGGIADKSTNSADKTLQLSHFDRCTANIQTCSVHGMANNDKCLKWSFYYSCDHLNALISSLNCRGYRESELLFVLNQDRNVITDLLSRCQPNKLNEDLPAPEVRKSQRLQETLHLKGGKASDSHLTLNETLVTALREYLINMEERIFASNYGLVTQISRDEWRQTVERESQVKEDLLKNLSYAILVLSQYIRSLYLTVPLSDENGVYKNWSQSLSQSISLSQLFVHLSILEHSIKWTKCAQKAYCKICRRKCDTEYMLLCDQCSRGHHTYCLQPSLDTVPRGQWLCPDCVPKFKPQSPKKQMTEANACDDSYSDWSTSDDENSMVSDSETTSDGTSSTQDYEICAHCRRMDSDLQLSCAKCHDFYHLNCAKVSRITRSEWFCSNCSKKRKISIDLSNSDDSLSSEDLPKRPKRSSRYSQDSDYKNEERVVIEDEKLTVNTSHRRRYNRDSAAQRKTLPLDFGLCEEILRKLQRHKDGWLFRCRPNNAPNYNKVIKKYMDFGLLVSNLNMGIYRTNTQFFRDVLLMLTNASVYNQKESPEYKSYLSLAQYFDELLNEYDVGLR